MQKLSSQDRSLLIRFASSLPAGSGERRSILADLQKTSYDRNSWRAGILRQDAKAALFVFRNKALQDLWNEEFTGQISDGMWENTANSGFEFWGNVETTVGSKTEFKGFVPDGIKKTFGFDTLIPIVGDRMLETIQKTEPAATMGTVILYTKEIMKALSSARKGVDAPDVIAPAGGEAGLDATTKALLLSAARKACLDASTIADKKPAEEALMYNTTGGRDGKYHYFLIVSGRYESQAISAYGSVGKTPKTVILTLPGDGYAMAIKAIKGKAKSKLSSGYVGIPTDSGLRQADLF